MAVLLFAFAGSSLSAASVSWTTNHDAALKKAKETNKPIVLFFTGSDWCGWCKKLESEALDTDAFAKGAGDKFIFVKLDYPMKTQQNSALAEQNAKLQNQYDVRSFPTIIILDANGKQIGVTGYRAGGGASYAEHLSKIVQDYSAYRQKMKTLGSDALSSTELKHLYRQAKEFGLKDDAQRIVKAGMKTDRATFFQIERYRHLGNEGKLSNAEAKKLKEQILADDPDNTHFCHYQVACIDFDHSLDQLENKETTVAEAVRPLEDYLQKFNKNDRDNVWRLEMMIAQVYVNHAERGKALAHAKSAHAAAPYDRKEDLASFILTIEDQ